MGFFHLLNRTAIIIVLTKIYTRKVSTDKFSLSLHVSKSIVRDFSVVSD